MKIQNKGVFFLGVYLNPSGVKSRLTGAKFCKRRAFFQGVIPEYPEGHPEEHPEGLKKMEHPEHPEGKGMDPSSKRSESK